MAENQKGRIAILISGRGSNMESIAEACESGSIPAQIMLVISNEPDAPGLQKARTRRVEAMVIDASPTAPTMATADIVSIAVFEPSRAIATPPTNAPTTPPRLNAVMPLLAVPGSKPAPVKSVVSQLKPR